MNREAVSARLREHRATLEKLGVKSLASFGSLARGEVGPESDADLLVEFSQPVGFSNSSASSRRWSRSWSGRWTW
jgi:predicted nucleotidyltransferase